jgi:hypothetical protein
MSAYLHLFQTNKNLLTTHGLNGGSLGSDGPIPEQANECPSR